MEGIATLIDEQGDYPAAAMQVRQLMFFERLRTNLADVVRQMGEGLTPGPRAVFRDVGFP
ncbi:iron-sulfur cluster co-chaperone HscB C-terminal domain-containing protein [Lautropia mirabilis]